MLIYVFYFMALAGVILLTVDPIIFSVNSRSARSKQFVSMKSRKEKNRFYLHLKRLLQTVSKSPNTDAGKRTNLFIFGCLGVFFIALTWLLPHFGPIAVGLAAFLAIAPYVILWTQLGNIRYKSSYEGEILIGELLNQYKLNHYNIVETLDRSVACLDQAPLSRRAVYRLSLRLKVAGSDEDLREALDDFLFTIGTSWAGMLTNNIYIAMKENLTVVAGLEDILHNCEGITEMLEEGRRQNTEGFAITKWLAPIMYFGLMYMAMQSVGFSLRLILAYQISSPTGIIMILVITALACFNSIVMNALSRQKYDF